MNELIEIVAALPTVPVRARSIRFVGIFSRQGLDSSRPVRMISVGRPEGMEGPEEEPLPPRPLPEAILE